jgi:hypothetical protein
MTETLDTLSNPTEINPPEEIPEGYVLDRDTKEYRPRKRRGRPAAQKPPTEHDTLVREPDTAPDTASRGKSSKGVPRWKAGIIAKGMSRLYRRTGKIIKAMDRDIGIAVIESADDCGEAWDELARTNPRVRAFLLKLIAGGTWSELFMAHLPILLAVVMKENIRKHIPFGRFLETAMESDETEEGLGVTGLNLGDVNQMMSTAQNMMAQMGMRVDPDE